MRNLVACCLPVGSVSTAVPMLRCPRPPQVRNALLKRAADFGIVLDDVAITHLSFGSEVCALLCGGALAFMGEVLRLHSV